MDPRCSPARVRKRHSPDERSDVGANRRSATAMSAPPGPVLSKSRSVPLDHGRRLHHGQHLVPACPPSSEQYPEGAVGIRQARALHRSPKHTDLLAQREVFQRKLVVRPKAGENGTDECAEEIEHGLPDSSSRSRTSRISPCTTFLGGTGHTELARGRDLTVENSATQFGRCCQLRSSVSQMG